MENKGENPFQAQVRETRTAINELTKEISAFERELVAHKGDACNIEKAIAFKTERLKMLYEEIASLMEKQAAHQSSVDAAMKRAGKDDPCTVLDCTGLYIGSIHIGCHLKSHLFTHLPTCTHSTIIFLTPLS